jgi:hypothetical protein
MPEIPPRPQPDEFEFEFDLGDSQLEVTEAETPTTKSTVEGEEDEAIIRRPSKKVSQVAAPDPQPAPAPATPPPAKPAPQPVVEDDEELVVRKSSRSRPKLVEPEPEDISIAEPEEKTEPVPEQWLEPELEPKAYEPAAVLPERRQPIPAAKPKTEELERTESVLNPFAGSPPVQVEERSQALGALLGRDEAREAVANSRRKERADPGLKHLDPLSDYRPASTWNGRRFAIAVVAVALLSGGAAFLFLGRGGGDDPPVASPGGGDEVVSVPETGSESTASGDAPNVGHAGEALADIKYRISESLGQFLAAKSPAELLPHVRDSERVKPMIEDYYGRHPFAMPQLYKVEGAEEGMVNLKAFWVVDAAMKEGGNKRFVMQDTERGFIVDWGMFVRYNPIDWEDYADQRPLEAKVFRVFASRDFKIGYAFPEAAGWLCVRLRTQGSERELYGYVLAGSETALALEEVLDSDWENHCMLELQFPADPKGGDDQLHIRALVSDGWLRID